MMPGQFFRKLVALKAQTDRAPGLPFTEILTENRLQQLFHQFQVTWRERIFTPCVTLWTFLAQTLSDDQSCAKAVARLLVYRTAQGHAPCSVDTSSYCQARQKLPEPVLTQLLRDTGRDLQQQTPAAWRAHGRTVKVIDGTTVSMPDTAANAAAFGKPCNQKGPCGFPLARLVVVFCLATGTVLDAAIGRYQGKAASELALLRSLDAAFQRGDLLLGDRLFGTYCDLARWQARGIDGVFRLHAGRRADFRRGRRLGPDDHVVVWHKPPKCPAHLSAAEFAALPATLTLREVRVRVAQVGFRVQTLVVVTTLTAPAAFTKEDIAALYRQRWQAELDLRSLKAVLHLDVLRCKAPALVRNEIWVHLLAYNLLRSVMCSAALEQALPVREISFKGTLQLVQEFYLLLVLRHGGALQAVCTILCTAAGQHRVGQRPNRYEPRKRKRPAKPYPPLKRSRQEERKHCA